MSRAKAAQAGAAPLSKGDYVCRLPSQRANPVRASRRVSAPQQGSVAPQGSPLSGVAAGPQGSAQSLQLDTSSADAAWASLMALTGGSHDRPLSAPATSGRRRDGDESEDGSSESDGNSSTGADSDEGQSSQCVWGRVSAVEPQLWGQPPGAEIVEVVVWRRADRCYVGGARRPRLRCPRRELQRLTPTEFWTQCKRDFMHEHSQYMRLKCEGHDDSAPRSLIAYNNKLISQLIERADIGRKRVVRDPTCGKIRGGRRAKLDAVRRHVPNVSEPKDPFGEVKDQLRALAAMGGGRGILARRGKRAAGVGTERTLAPRAAARNAHDALLQRVRDDFGEAQFLSSQSRSGFRRGAPPGERALTPADSVGMLLQRQQADVLSTVTRRMAGRRAGFDATVSAASISRSPSPTTGWLTPVSDGHRVSVTRVEPGGRLLLSRALPGASTAEAFLEGVQVPVIPVAMRREAGPFNPVRSLMELCSGTLRASAMSSRPDGVLTVDLRSEDGEWINLLAIDSGTGCVSYSQVENHCPVPAAAFVEVIPGSLAVPVENEPKGEYKIADKKRLWAAQREAIKSRVGLWQIDNAATNFLAHVDATRAEGAVQVDGHSRPALSPDGSLSFDSECGETLPGLFDAFFSSADMGRILERAAVAASARARYATQRT